MKQKSYFQTPCALEIHLDECKVERDTLASKLSTCQGHMNALCAERTHVGDEGRHLWLLRMLQHVQEEAGGWLRIVTEEEEQWTALG